MAADTPFQPASTTGTIAASTTTASFTWTSDVNHGDCLRVYNSTAAIVFVRHGPSPQTAVITDIPIGPGLERVFRVADRGDTVAVILSTGTGNVYVTKGEGV